MPSNSQSDKSVQEFDLSKKVESGACPLPECGCFHRDEYYWLKFQDVKEFIKLLFVECCEEATTDGVIGLSQIRRILDKFSGDDLK